MSLVEQYTNKIRDKKSSLSLQRQKGKQKSKHAPFSWKGYLRNAGKSNAAFELMVSRLRLEELIALKLDLASSSIGKGMFGYPLYCAIDRIVRLSAMIFASSVTTSRTEASSLLGISPVSFKGLEYTSLRANELLSARALDAMKFDKLLR